VTQSNGNLMETIEWSCAAAARHQH